MRKNPHSRILKWEFKEQHLSTVPKSYSKYICTYHNNRNIGEVSLFFFFFPSVIVIVGTIFV